MTEPVSNQNPVSPEAPASEPVAPVVDETVAVGPTGNLMRVTPEVLDQENPTRPRVEGNLSFVSADVKAQENQNLEHPAQNPHESQDIRFIPDLEEESSPSNLDELEDLSGVGESSENPNSPETESSSPATTETSVAPVVPVALEDNPATDVPVTDVKK